MGGKLVAGMRPKVAASLVVLGIAVLPACSAASKAGSTSSQASSQTTSSQTGSTQSTAGSGGTTNGSGAAGATGNPKSARIKVKPGSGHKRTHFAVSFTAPQRTGTFNGA